MDEAVQDRVWETLRGYPGATSTELAQHSKVARATIVKLLEAWVEEGSVTATPGPKPRSATRWTAVPLNTTVTTDPTELTPVTAPGGDGAPASSIPHATQPNGADAASPQTATGPLTQRTSPAGASRGGRPSVNRSGSERLVPGALKGLVEDFLTEHPGEHGPTAISHAIGRSQGAIANALERLVTTGWAERTNEAPKRYRIANETNNAPDTTPEASASAASELEPTTDTTKQSHAPASSARSERAQGTR